MQQGTSSTEPNFSRSIKTTWARSTLASVLAVLAISACSSPYTISVNNNAVFDPQDRLYTGEVRNADLQGCINFALTQQKLKSSEELQVLACANSEVTELTNIANLTELRFLDLGSNRISNLAPLERLRKLSGLNLSNNQVKDISPLLRIATLRSLSLIGNNQIPCDDVALLENKLGANFTAPESCTP